MTRMSRIVVIAGSGRSGTTWVQDAVATANNMKTLFEPLHPVAVPSAGRFACTYIDPNDDCPELRDFMDRVFSGNFRSLWANYRIRPDRFNPLNYSIPGVVHNLKKLSRHYRKYRGGGDHGMVVKFIRANLMLPWISRVYDHRILLLVRHPAAVVSSRLRLPNRDWYYRNALDRYLADNRLMRLFAGRYDLDVNRIDTPEAGLACIWCIENVLPLRWARQWGYTVAFYEHLMSNPVGEWDRIITGLGLEYCPDPDLLGMPSQQVSSNMRQKTFNESHLARWRENFTVDRIEEVKKVLDMFEVDCYQVEDDFPIRNA
jgi:hypothetical protein